MVGFGIHSTALTSLFGCCAGEPTAEQTTAQVAADRHLPDMLFLASHMKLRDSPLHTAHPHDEVHLFNKFLKEHPRPTAKTWEELVALFKAKSNCQTIFPKLLSSMLRKFCKTWRLNQELVVIKESVKTDCHGLLKNLGQPSCDENSANSPAAAFQKNASDQQMETPIGGIDLGETVTEAAIADSPCNPTPVPLPAAPAQTGCVLSGDGRGKKKHRCSTAHLDVRGWQKTPALRMNGRTVI